MVNLRALLVQEKTVFSDMGQIWWIKVESAVAETNNTEDADSSTGITEEESAVSLIVRQQKSKC